MMLANRSQCPVVSGKLRMTTVVEGVTREYFLHIPTKYNGNTSVPLVFMLHGTGGDGEKMYETSGWAELAESENFIAIFPSSLKHKIIDGGEYKTIAKWNHTPDADWTFQAGEIEKDDIKFLRRALDEVINMYNIDTKRVYLNGFSNGGSMAAKCSIEMSDVLAAVAASAGSFYLDTTYVPKRKIPVLYQVGNKDYGPGNEGPEVPMIFFDSLISTPGINYKNGKFYRVAVNYTNNFGYKKEHKIIGDTNFAVFAYYLPIDMNANREFLYVLVKGLEHNYPNWAPARHWEWMKKYTLDNTGTTGVSELFDEVNTLILYPNPIKDEVVFQKELNWSIFDQWGRHLMSGNGKSIRVQHLTSGVYLVKTEDGVGRFVKL